MSKASKSRVRDPRLKNAASSVKSTTEARANSPGASSKSLLAKIKTLNVWREQFNPLVGLDMPRARSLLQLGQRCEYADLQWTNKFVEERFPTLFALIERRTSVLMEMDWDIRTVPSDELPDGATEADAEAQATFLREGYDRIENLYDAIEHLAMATFRGYAHLQKQDKDGDGEIDNFEVLDQWNFVRKGQRGNWFWNPDALQTSWQGLPKENEIQGSGTVQYAEDGSPSTLLREEFIIREVKRPVDPIALIAFIGWSMGKKDHRGFVEIYGIPGGVVIGPPNVSADKELDYQASGQEIADGGSGYLPYGADWKPNDGPRGVNPFKEFLRSEVEDVVLAGTGGLLTMLTESGSGTLAGEAHADTFNKIGRKEAKQISEVFQKQFDRDRLRAKFPDKPVLAYFQLAANEETSTSQVVEDAAKLSQAGYEIEPEELSEKTGYTLTRKIVLPPTRPGMPQDAQIQNRSRRVQNRTIALQSVFEELLVNAEEAYGSAQSKVFAPLRERLAECLKIANRDEQVLALRNLQRELPGMLKAMNAKPETATVLERAMNSALAIGVEQSGQMVTNRDLILNGDVPGHEFHGNQWSEAAAAEHSRLRGEAESARHAAHVAEYETPNATDAQIVAAHRTAADKYQAVIDHAKASGDPYAARVIGSRARAQMSVHKDAIHYFTKLKK